MVKYWTPNNFEKCSISVNVRSFVHLKFFMNERTNLDYSQPALIGEIDTKVAFLVRMRLSNIGEDHLFFISFGINCQLQSNNYTFIFKHLAGMYFYSIFIYSTTFMYVNKNLRYSVILFPQWKHFVYSFIRTIIQRKKKALEKRHHIFLKCFLAGLACNVLLPLIIVVQLFQTVGIAQ